MIGPDRNDVNASLQTTANTDTKIHFIFIIFFITIILTAKIVTIFIPSLFLLSLFLIFRDQKKRHYIFAIVAYV